MTRTHEVTAVRTQRQPDPAHTYRRLLALVAPLPMIAEGAKYLTARINGDATFAQQVAAMRGHSGTGQLAAWLDLVFFAFLIPAVIACGWLTWRSSRRLTLAAMLLTVPGFAIGFGGNFNSDLLANLTASKNFDAVTMQKLADAAQAQPSVGIASLLFILGIVIGLLLLGIALIKSDRVPKAYGLALAAGGFTHPFLGAAGHVAQGIGL